MRFLDMLEELFPPDPESPSEEDEKWATEQAELIDEEKNSPGNRRRVLDGLKEAFKRGAQAGFAASQKGPTP